MGKHSAEPVEEEPTDLSEHTELVRANIFTAPAGELAEK